MGQIKIYNTLSPATYDSNLIEISGTPRENGSWEQKLIKNDDMETGSYYQFTWSNRTEKKIVTGDVSSYNDLVSV